MKNIISGLKNKKVRYGAYSTITAILVVFVLIVVNVIAGAFNKSFDLTPDQQFSISEDSEEILNDVDQEVNIYALFQTGQEDIFLDSLLTEYDDASDYINYEVVDPYVNPQFVDAYKTDGEEISTGSVIVESDLRFKVIPVSDMYSTDYTQALSYDAEPEITNAIRYVSSSSTPMVYEVTGHNEPPLGEEITKQVELANYQVSDLDLLLDEIPEDCDILLINTPERDYTTDEADKVKEYLAAGGRAFITTDAMYSGDVEEGTFPNYRSIYNTYGIDTDDAITVEANENFILDSTRPLIFIPQLAFEDITGSLVENNSHVVLDASTPIQSTEITKQSVTVESVLTTTDEGYAKTGEEITTIEKEAGDMEGPVPVAVAITDNQSVASDTVAKLIVVGSSSIVYDQYNSIIGGGNAEFIVNSFNWLNDSTDNVYISSYVPDPETLTLTVAGVISLALYSLIVLPLIIIIVGLVIWLKRRNR